MSGRRFHWILAGAGLAGMAVLLMVMETASVTNVSAIPAFARKYQTSCQTCHIVFPNLTPFGEAFRLNGYRFPEGTDSSVSKDQPVPLGAEGYKKLWPKSVWPGEMPGMPPVSLLVESEVAYDKAEKITSFDDFAGEVAVLAGGTMGDHASFYGEVEFARSDGEVETEIERVNLQFRPFTSPAFQFKVGSFEPGLLLVSNHRRLTDYRYMMLDMPVADNQWTAEPYQQGIEFFGVAAHRLQYNAGYVEGSGNLSNNAKDYYVRVGYKIGGLALDGTTDKGSDAGPSNPKPWSEKSVRISAFYYKGMPLLDNPPPWKDPFDFYGGDVAWNFNNLIVNAGLSDRSDDFPVIGDTAYNDVKVKNRFGEVSYVVFPWLVPAARWESFDEGGQKTERVSLTLDFLIRANVKGFIATDQVKMTSGSTSGSYDTEEVVGGVVFGF